LTGSNHSVFSAKHSADLEENET